MKFHSSNKWGSSNAFCSWKGTKKSSPFSALHKSDYVKNIKQHIFLQPCLTYAKCQRADRPPAGELIQKYAEHLLWSSDYVLISRKRAFSCESDFFRGLSSSQKNLLPSQIFKCFSRWQGHNVFMIKIFYLNCGQFRNTANHSDFSFEKGSSLATIF